MSSRDWARCAEPGCVNFARSGEPFCTEHRGQGELEGESRAEFIDRLYREDEANRLRRRAEFEERMASGEYRKLFGPKVASLMEQAAQDTGLADELGALRVVMAQALELIEDPAECARTVATVARATVQVQRGQRAASGRLAEAISEAITEILEELDGGSA